MDSAPKKLKVVFCGDAGVGKTALLKRYTADVFDQFTNATTAVKPVMASLDIIESEPRVTNPVQLWDTPGQDALGSLTTLHYRGADGALACYDVSRPATLSRLSKWLDEVRAHAPAGVVVAVIANKCDLVGDSGEHLEALRKGLSFAQSNGCLFFETSAKWGRAQGLAPSTRGMALRGGIEVVLRALATHMGKLSGARATAEGAFTLGKQAEEEDACAC